MQTTVFSEKQAIQVEQLRLPLVRRPRRAASGARLAAGVYALSATTAAT
jgi:hypothetical protein